MRTSSSLAALLIVTGSMAFTAGALFGQTPAPAFEVASIKTAEPPTQVQFRSGQVRIGMQMDAARVNIKFMSLTDLIAAAYRVKPFQISGPGWMATERFDAVAKIPEGASRDLVPEMLQSLLAERFNLTVHRENKEHAVYALVVGKNGPKLKESPPDADSPAADGAPGAGAMGTADGGMRINRDSKGVVVTGGRAGTTRMSMGPGGTMRLEGEKMTTAVLADMLTRFVDRPVLDMTELKGTYQVALDLSIEDMRNAARNAGMMMPGPGAGGDPARPPSDSASDPSGGSIFAAVQTLGLKLEPRKAPVDFVVVDHLDRMPTEN